MLTVALFVLDNHCLKMKNNKTLALLQTQPAWDFAPFPFARAGGRRGYVLNREPTRWTLGLDTPRAILTYYLVHQNADGNRAATVCRTDLTGRNLLS